MRALGHHRLITARDLVLALGARLDALEALLDRPLDGAVVAELKMEEGDLLDAAPIAPLKRVGADEIQRAGNAPGAAIGEEQQNLVPNALADKIEEGAGKIRPAPLP